ncbi:MAG: segregation/condensation protein A [Fibrobacterota bacterium]
MNYEVQLDLFKGPLDLLLYLIRKEEISIREIEVSKITDQYIAYIEMMKELDLELAGEFLVMAAILMRLKAHELLPQEERDKSEMDDDFIDREKLIRQIEEYERFKSIAGVLKEKEDENFGAFYRTRVEGVTFSADDFLAQKDVELYDLLIAFRRVVETAKKTPVYFMEADNITIDDRIERVMSVVADLKQVPFTRLFEDDNRKLVMVVTFMAILELIKMGHIGFRQDAFLGEILVYEKVPEAEAAIGNAVDGMAAGE